IFRQWVPTPTAKVKPNADKANMSRRWLAENTVVVCVVGLRGSSGEQGGEAVAPPGDHDGDHPVHGAHFPVRFGRARGPSEEDNASQDANGAEKLERRQAFAQKETG